MDGQVTEKSSAGVLVSNEFLIDALAYAGEPIPEWMLEWERKAQAELDARWRALPLRVRIWRRLTWRLAEPRGRVRFAWQALLHGHECDR